jgi:hypothetical protein
MKAPRLAIALLALGATLVPLTTAGALSVPKAAKLTLPQPNSGLNQGYLPFQSCSSAGNCAITGIYVAGNNNASGVITYETKGAWQAPVSVTPPAGYVGSKGVTMEGLSCPADGACLALGQYSTTSDLLPFVVNEVKSAWQIGARLSLPHNAMTTNESATPHSVACVSAGNCTIVGTYTTDTPNFATEGFVATQTKGVWQTPLEVSLPTGANVNPLVSLSQVSCWSQGSCVAVGSYVDTNNVSHAVVVPEVNGQWKSAMSISLPGNASAFAGAQFSEVSCAAVDSCLALGTYNTITGAVQPLVAMSTASQWARGVEVVLPDAARNPETLIYGFKGVSCATPGNCALGGQFLDKAGHYQGFLDNIVNGAVRRAAVLSLPSGAIQAGHNGGVVSVSCPTPGTCVAGAAYLSAANKYQALVISESNNAWSSGSTVSLPGNSHSVGVAGGIYSVQCFTTTTCQVSGSYQSTGARYDGFSLVTAA